MKGEGKLKITLIIMSIFAILVLLIWLGLQITPKSFAPISNPSTSPKLVPLPADLPLPVARFYRQIYGERIPVIKTAIISGRGKLRLNGITFPARFRFTHITGQDYRHYIEATFYGQPLLKVNEYFLNGSSRFELIFGTSKGPKIDQGANLALWAEAIWMPAVWVTDPQVRWEPVDAHTALLFVPFGAEWEQFLVRFDPQTGLIDLLESMRYKGEESKNKTLWLNQVLKWDLTGKNPTPEMTAITWFDEGKPWAVFTTEEVVYHLDVAAYIQEKGP
jgi:hypothetical protein